MFGEEELIKLHRDRAQLISNIILIMFGIVLARLWYLQIYKGKLLLDYSLRNRLRQEIVKAPRGMIFSRNNHILVDNIPRFDAIVTPQYLRDKKKTLNKLSQILEIKHKVLKKRLKKYAHRASYRPVIVKKNISRKEVALIETENFNLPGVSVNTFISRKYLDSEVGAHILGYISEISKTQLPKYRKRDRYNYRLGDFIGQFGLEEELDLVLRGKNGHEFVEVDAFGRQRRNINKDNLFKGIKNLSAVPGKNVRLTIDRDLQIAANSAMKDKVGAVVAIDVKTGEILAMVSTPAFRPSEFSKGLTSEYWNSLTQNEFNPMLDRTIQEHYSPGSTFKVISAIAGLEAGLIDEKTEVRCKGSFRLGRRVFHCWRRHGHGKVNVVKALTESCDVFFYKLATKLDIDVLAKYARMFGFGRKTGIALPREIPGLIPTKEWKKKKNGVEWQLGETLTCIIGQSYVLSTPLQLAMGFSAIANKGKLFRPYLVKEVFTNSGEILKKFSPKQVGEVTLKEKNWDIVKKALYKVVNTRKGTAYWQRGKGIAMSGKTGTSQVIKMSAEKLFSKCSKNEYKFRHHGIFGAYAPYSDPSIAVAVVIEHGCSGSSSAAPVAKAIITAYMKKYRKELREKIIKEEKKRMLKNIKKQ